MPDTASEAHGDLVDLHSHLVTDDYREAAIRAGHVQPDGMPGWPAWSASDHLGLMDELGISRSFLSISTPGVHFGDDAAARDLARRTNLGTAKVVAAYPDRFGQFGSLPLPDVAGAIDEARFVLDELGAQGVAVLSNARGVYLGDSRLEPLWEELDDRGTLVFVHPTSPPHHEAVASNRPRPMIEFLFDTARAVTDLVLTGTLIRHPRIRFVVTHGGGVLPLLADRVELFNRHHHETPAAGVRVACGLPGSGIAGFRRSHHEASHAERLGRLAGIRAPIVLDYRDVSAVALLAADITRANDFARRELGEVAAVTDQAAVIRQTLLRYLDAERSLTTAPPSCHRQGHRGTGSDARGDPREASEPATSSSTRNPARRLLGEDARAVHRPTISRRLTEQLLRGKVRTCAPGTPSASTR